MQKIHGREARNLLFACQRDECLRLLETWKDSSITENGHGASQTAFYKLSTSIQYFELLLCIYAQELLQPVHSSQFEKARLSILKAAQEILGSLNDMDNFTVAADWYIQPLFGGGHNDS